MLMMWNEVERHVETVGGAGVEVVTMCGFACLLDINLRNSRRFTVLILSLHLSDEHVSPKVKAAQCPYE